MKHVVETGRWSVLSRAVLFVLLAGLAVFGPGPGSGRLLLAQDEPKADAAAAAAPAEQAAAAATDGTARRQTVRLRRYSHAAFWRISGTPAVGSGDRRSCWYRSFWWL